MCAYIGEFYKYSVVYKVTCTCCGDFYVGNTQNTQKTLEEHFQYVPPKVMNDKNSDSLSDHFAKTFTQKLIPQKCRDIMSFNILSTVNPYSINENLG